MTLPDPGTSFVPVNDANSAQTQALAEYESAHADWTQADAALQDAVANEAAARQEAEAALQRYDAAAKGYDDARKDVGGGDLNDMGGIAARPRVATKPTSVR